MLSPLAGGPPKRVLLGSTRNDHDPNHSTRRCPCGFPRAHRRPRPHARTGCPPGARRIRAAAARARLRRGRVGRAAAPGPVRRRPDRRPDRGDDHRAAPARGHGGGCDGFAVNVAVDLAPVVALVGNPNCGKTALYNALTGSRQKVANYPGVTVEKKMGRLSTPAGRPVEIVDLPGTYSLRARSPDEEITRDAVLGRLASERAPDLIVCVADASNLRLALRLALELKHVGRPVMMSLNMMDIARKRGIEIDLAVL